MTKQELEAIRAMCEAASEGPWRTGKVSFMYQGIAIRRGESGADLRKLASVEHWRDSEGGIFDGTANADFIAHSRTDIPALLDAIDEKDGEIERLRELALCDNCGRETIGYCNGCDNDD